MDTLKKKIIKYKGLAVLADPCQARGCSTSIFIIHEFINSASHPFPPTDLQRPNSQMIVDSTSSCKIDYGQLVKTSLYPEGHETFTGSKVRTIFAGGGDFTYWWS